MPTKEICVVCGSFYCIHQSHKEYMVNKTISPNLAPWNWRLEQPAVHVDSGPTVAASDTQTEPGVSIESKPVDLGVGVLKSDLVPYKNLDCIEDGKVVNEIR